MEVTKEQELAWLKRVGIEDVEAFLYEKKLVYASESFLIYEDEDSRIVSVGFKPWSHTFVYGKGNTYVSGNGDTCVFGKGETEVRGNGNTCIFGKGDTEVRVNGEIRITKSVKE